MEKEIIIYGQTPTKKNSKRIMPNWDKRTVRLISSKKALDWQEDALKQLDPLKLRIRPRGRLEIDYMFYCQDERQLDLDNLIATVNDLLQIACSDFWFNPKKRKLERVKKTGIIIGDHWKVLKIGSADATVDRENPRCVLTIREI